MECVSIIIYEGWNMVGKCKKKCLYAQNHWYVNGDGLTEALHILQLQSSPLTTFIANKIPNGNILVQA